MAAILILAHAPLASALKQAALHAYAEHGQLLQAVDIPASGDLPAIHAQASLALRLALEGAHSQEVLILTDIFGATPCNIASRLAQEFDAKVVTGVNVPMLWRVLNYIHNPLDDLVAKALGGAIQGVMQISLPKPQQQALVTSHAQDDHHHQQ